VKSLKGLKEAIGGAGIETGAVILNLDPCHLTIGANDHS